MSADDMHDIDYIDLSIDQGDYENAAILAMKAARRASDERLAAHLASDALTLSNLALAQEYRKARQ